MSSTRQLTLRAIASGILLGALLTPCNIYSGLKIGWSFNVSIAALLLATGFWALLDKLRVATTLNRTEANLTQTGASSAANIISGGLVAPIPALAMISGGNLPLQQLVPWVFAVSFFGIWVAWYLRGNLILRAQLPFPTGRATAETLCEIFERGREATLKLRVLMSAALIAGTAKWVDTGIMALPRPSLGFLLPATGKLAGAGSISAKNLTFSFDPSLMLAGFGAIIGLRNGVSLLLGGLLAWGILGPLGLAQGFVEPGRFDTDVSWFSNMIKWLLWPGVALMVASALTRFFLQVADPSTSDITPAERDSRLDRMLRFAGLVVGSGLVVVAQITLFDISLPLAVITVPIAFLLAVVASRVVGETGIPPIGAIGKVSQLGTGITAPGDITANLIGANAAGGAAGQSADLLNDFKVGHVVGTPARLQVIAQIFGILTGSLVGSLVYLALIPDPAAMLMTEEWPAPAVATWKVVAETLAGGFGNLPAGALTAAYVFGLIGAAGAWLQHRHTPRWLPNMPALGLAMVVPASLSITMFLGSLVGALLTRFRFNLAQRFLIAAASGLIAGESLTGVARAMIGILG